MSLFKVIERYDRERESYIFQLEQKLKAERELNARLTTLLMSATATNERKTLELILSGHFDRFVKKEETSG